MYGEGPQHRWPEWGEYDIIEGVHEMTRVMTTLHTSAGCDQSRTLAKRDFSRQWLPGTSGNASTNCDVRARDQWYNQGCSQSGPPFSLGSSFNNRGGGTFAAEWDPEALHIRTWFWEAGMEPLDVLNKAPTPEAWGQPYSFFSLSPEVCSTSHFVNMRLVIDITFCGDLGFPTYKERCPGYAGEMSCEELVSQRPELMQEAYWSLRALDVYQKPGNPTPLLLEPAMQADVSAGMYPFQGPPGGIAIDPQKTLLGVAAFFATVAAFMAVLAVAGHFWRKDRLQRGAQGAASGFDPNQHGLGVYLAEVPWALSHPQRGLAVYEQAAQAANPDEAHWGQRGLAVYEAAAGPDEAPWAPPTTEESVGGASSWWGGAPQGHAAAGYKAGKPAANSAFEQQDASGSPPGAMPRSRTNSWGRGPWFPV
jgi:hypothetical protein